MTAYQFDDFVLTKDNLLMKACAAINLSPKESGVLRVLLENAGSIVSKEKIVQDVWLGGIVSDESLTRCLYILRKRLGENEENKFIDTQYGKGYRFVKTVQSLSEIKTEVKIAANPVSKRVALLPFIMSDFIQTLRLHDRLFDHASTAVWQDVSFLPALMYTPEQFQQSLQSLLRSADYPFILFGREMTTEDKRVLRIELIKSAGHAIVGQRTLELTDCHHRNSDAVRHTIEMLLRRLSIRIDIPHLRRVGGALALNLHTIRSSSHSISGL